MAWALGAITPISSRKIVPPSASANRPFLLATAPVKAPRTWPKSSDSISVSGSAAQFTRTSGISRWALQSWMARATSSLPVPVSPMMSTVLRDWATTRAFRDDLLNRAAPAHDAVVVELLVALGDEVVVVGTEPAQLDRACGHDEELVDFEGLLQVVEGAELHGFDRALDRRVRRHHQNLRTLAGARRTDDLTDQLESAELGHQIVHDEQIERPLADQPQRLARAASRVDVVPLVAKGLGQGLSNLRLVVDEQDRSTCQRRGLPHGTVWQVNGDGRAFAGLAFHAQRSAKSFDHVLGDRQTESRAVATGREERIEHVRQVLVRDARAAVGDRDAPASGLARRLERIGDPGARSVRARTACCALVRRLTRTARSRSTSVTIGSLAAVTSMGTSSASAVAASAASRQMAPRFASREGERDRPGEVQHARDDPVQSGHFLVDAHRRVRDIG